MPLRYRLSGRAVSLVDGPGGVPLLEYVVPVRSASGLPPSPGDLVELVSPVVSSGGARWLSFLIVASSVLDPDAVLPSSAVLPSYRLLLREPGEDERLAWEVMSS